MVQAHNSELNITTHGTGPDVVLLHGWGMHSGIWSTLLDTLARNHRVTTIDLPGHGLSPMQADFSMEKVCAELLAVAPETAAWLGWSLGGLMAQWIALHHPERVNKLILVATTPHFVQALQWPHALAPEVLQQFADSLRQDYTKTLQRFMALQTRGSDQASETLRALRASLAQRPQPNMDALGAGLEMLRSVDLRGDVGEIRLPVLWLLGGRDMLVPVQVSSRLSSIMPQAEVRVLSHAGHAPFLSHPDEFVELVSDFMSV
jgi:pimeloyl-[acyl-carrier protein] methyl ester esterase